MNNKSKVVLIIVAVVCSIALIVVLVHFIRQKRLKALDNVTKEKFVQQHLPSNALPSSVLTSDNEVSDQHSATDGSLSERLAAFSDSVLTSDNEVSGRGLSEQLADLPIIETKAFNSEAFLKLSNNDVDQNIIKCAPLHVAAPRKNEVKEAIRINLAKKIDEALANIHNAFDKVVGFRGHIALNIEINLKTIFTIATQHILNIVSGHDIENIEIINEMSNNRSLSFVGIIYCSGRLYFITNQNVLLDTICSVILEACKANNHDSAIIERLTPFVFKLSDNYEGDGYKYADGNYGYESKRHLHEEILHKDNVIQENIYSQEIKLDSFIRYLDPDLMQHESLFKDEIKRSQQWINDDYLLSYDTNHMPRIAIFPVSIIDNEVFPIYSLGYDNINNMISLQIINYIRTEKGLLGNLTISLAKDEEADTMHQIMHQISFTIDGIPFHKMCDCVSDGLILEMLGIPIEKEGILPDISGVVNQSKRGLKVKKLEFQSGYGIIPQISYANLNYRIARFMEMIGSYNEEGEDLNPGSGAINPVISHVLDLPLAEYCKMCLEYKRKHMYDQEPIDKDNIKKIEIVLQKLAKLTDQQFVVSSIESSEEINFEPLP